MTARHGTYASYNCGCRCMDCTKAGMAHRRRGLLPGDPRHGTVNGYNNLGCRCEACRRAHADDVAEAKVNRVLRGLAPGDPRHGTTTGYNQWGCRCDECREEGTNASRDYRLRHRGATA